MKILRLPEVLAIVPLSKGAFLTGVRSGRWPKPLKIGASARGWIDHEILEAVNKLASSRRN
jgi:prophage regulatory protein